jgi:hypothetical protein
MNKEVEEATTTTTDHGKIFSFSEIVHERKPSSSVRMTNDGFLYAVDLAMVVTGHSRDQAEFALQWLPGSSNNKTIKLIDRPAIGGSSYKIITFEHAIELVMILPCEADKETRIKFANVIRRHLAGDESFVSSSSENARSGEPIAQLLLASRDTNKRIFRKRGLEQDGTLMHLIICEKKQKILMQEIELKEKHATTLIKLLEVQKTLIDSYTSLCENKVLDDEVKLLFKENILKLAHQSILVDWDDTADSMNVCASS